MRLRRVAVGLAVAGLLTLTGASAAWADSPVPITSPIVRPMATRATTMTPP